MSTARRRTASPCCTARGLPITPVPLDVDDDNSVRAAAAQVGPVDALVNNAGIGSAAPLELIPLGEAKAMFETNVFGALRMVQAVLPAMRERRSGSIVNVTSMMGRLTLPCHGIYSATKFALAALSETLAMEVRGFGIRVASIEPGVILTPIWGKRSVPLPQEHPYAQGMGRLYRTFGAQMEGGTTPDVVAEAIFTAACADGPLHVPVGDDAQVLLQAVARAGAEEWVSIYSDPDEQRFVARATELCGVDILNPPSLHARRKSAAA